MDVDRNEQELSLHQRILQLAGLDIPDEYVNDELRDVLERCSIELPADIARRLRPYIWLETNQTEIDQCDLSVNIDKLKFLKDKKSASKSWIMFGRLMGQPVAIKLTAQPHVENVPSHFLGIERTIYREFINPIVLCGFSPHVLIYYATIECEEFFAVREINKEVQKLKRSLQTATNEFNIQHIYASVVEQAIAGVSLTEFLENTISNPQLHVEELIALLFQIFYTLKVFGQLGLAHNDLHSENVFVVPTTSRTRYYEIDGNQVYRVTSQFEVRIFDFDRASKVPTVINDNELENYGLSRGGYCREFGQCNAVNESVEIFPLVHSIHIVGRQQLREINDLIGEIIPFDVLDRAYKGQQVEGTDYPVTYPIIPGHTFVYSGRLCTCNDHTCSSCTILNDPRILGLDDILQLDQFRAYLIDKDTVPDNEFIWQLPAVASEQAEQNWQQLHA